MSNFSKQVDRNFKGIEFEKNGEIDKAIALYEANIRENFEGSHPYDRLEILYRKQKRYNDELRVLEKAIYVFENLVSIQRPDRNPKLKRYKERYLKALNKLNKQ